MGDGGGTREGRGPAGRLCSALLPARNATALVSKRDQGRQELSAKSYGHHPRSVQPPPGSIGGRVERHGAGHGAGARLASRRFARPEAEEGVSMAMALASERFIAEPLVGWVAGDTEGRTPGQAAGARVCVYRESEISHQRGRAAFRDDLGSQTYIGRAHPLERLKKLEFPEA
jgi:hypothetical protein